MSLFKAPLLFCGIAFALAMLFRLALLIGSRLTGTLLFSATQRGWIGLLGIWWVASFLLALGIAKAYHVFPPFVPK